MSKRKGIESFIKERVEIPRVTKGDHGATVLLCPFCNPTHPLRADGISPCGTSLRVQAVQTVYRANYSKNMVCVKCGKSNGNMVSWQGTAYVHTPDCTPGTVTLPEAPRYFKLAALAGKNNAFAKTVEKIFGYRAQRVDEVDQKGQRTGVILGWTWIKK